MSETVYLSFSAEIRPHTAESLILEAGKLAKEGTKDVHLMFATAGGTIQFGIAIYNTLRSMPYKLTTYNMSSVDSVGNVIFLAGAERFACPGSQFMFHGAAFDPVTQKIGRQFLQESLERLNADEAQMQGIVRERTGLSAGDTLNLYAKQSVIDAADAVALGMVQGVKCPVIPHDADVRAFVFNRPA